MINIAVVGVGIMGVDHIKAIQQSSRCRLCAVCDVRHETAQNIAVKYGVPYFTDYREIPCKTNADAVILNLPHFLHCESTVYFLEKGLNVLVEKPMANTLSECDKMIEAEKKSRKKLAVAHIQRFFEANRRVKEVIKSKKLGDLCMFSEVRTVNYFNESRPKWFLSKKSAGGGIVMNYGAHAFDKLFYTLDVDCADIASLTGNIKNDADIEGHAQILARLPGNVGAGILFSGYAPSGYEAAYYFTDGVVKIADGMTFWQCRDGIWEKENIKQDFTNAIKLEIDEFCKYLSGEESEIPTSQYGRSIIEAIHKVYDNSK